MAAKGGALHICVYVEVFLGSLGMVVAVAAMICVSSSYKLCYTQARYSHFLWCVCTCLRLSPSFSLSLSLSLSLSHTHTHTLPLSLPDGAVLFRGTGGTQY